MMMKTLFRPLLPALALLLALAVPSMAVLPDMCLKMEPVVSCDAGVVKVTLTGIPSPELEIASLTPGVSINPSFVSPFAGSRTYTLTGASQGQYISVIGTVAGFGPGAFPGTDLCCTGIIQFVVPDIKACTPLAMSAAAPPPAPKQPIIIPAPKPKPPVVSKPPAPKPPVVILPPKGPSCDPSTTVDRGNSCVCRFGGAVKVSATACVCPQGTRLDARQGRCEAVIPDCKRGTEFNPRSGRCEVVRPDCKRGTEFNPRSGRCEVVRPDCKRGTEFNPRSGRCEVVRPDCKRGTEFNPRSGRCEQVRPVCRPPMIFDAKRNRCVQPQQQCRRGEVMVNGQCIGRQQCPRGTVLNPRNGRCVKIERSDPKQQNPQGDRPTRILPRG